MPRATPRGEEFVREARRIATLASPNLARVREVALRGDDLVVFGEFIEGERLHGALAPRASSRSRSRSRVLVDVLTGLGALHNLRDAKQQPMKLAHGELSPATIVLGLDGIARVLHAVARCAPARSPRRRRSRTSRPRSRRASPYDARADVFGAGRASVGSRSAASGSSRQSELPPNARRVRARPAASSDGAGEGAVGEGARGRRGQGARGVAGRSVADRCGDGGGDAQGGGLKLAPASTAAAFARSAFGERVKKRTSRIDAKAQAERLAATAPARACPRRRAAARPGLA